MSGAVVDANVLCDFLDHLLTGADNDVSRLFECLQLRHGFALDEGGKIQHQWCETCNNVAFHGWLLEALKNGTIKLVEASLGQSHKKHLREKCGFPYNQRHEGTYVEVAYCSQPHVLITHDIDFWEPEAKSYPSKKKETIKSKGKGSVASYLLGTLNVRVLSPEQALVALDC